MKKKTRRRVFFWALAIVGIGLVFYFFFPRQETGRLIPREQAPAVKVYFFKGDKLTAVERLLSPDEAPLPKAIAELLAGPKKDEAARGMTTEIPKGTKAISVKALDGTAIVNLTRKLEAYGGGSARLEGMVAQLVYTATEVPGVKKAWIWVEGKREVVLGGEGLVLDHPLSRREIGF